MRMSAEMLDALCSPSGYAMVRLGHELYPWQVAAMDGVEERGSRVALRTCNESGKTSRVIADVVLWHMETFPGSLTVTTSSSYRQVADQLYPVLRAQAEALERREGRKVFKILQDRGVCLANGSRLISFSTRDAGRAEGWHEPAVASPLLESGRNLLGEYGVGDGEWEEMVGAGQRTSLLMVIDEAKTVAQGIWDAFERCHPTRFLVASSPGGPAGAFYDCFTRQRHRYVTVHAAARDCPHLWEVPERRRELEEQREVLNPALVASMIDGDFATSGDGLVFDMAAVAAAMSGTLPRWGRGTRRAAIDLSGGGDEQVLFMRDGNECWIDGVWHERDEERLAGLVIARLQVWQMRPEWVWADNGGLGLTILNTFDRKGWRFNRVDFGAASSEPKFYANLRAEMYFHAARRIKGREVLLPRDDELRTQLGWIKHLPYDGSPLKLEKKEKLPRSPDRADSLVMVLMGMPAAREFAERREQEARSLSPVGGTGLVREDGGGGFVSF